MKIRLFGIIWGEEVGRRQKSEVRNQKSEVGSQKSEVGRQKSGVGNQKTEVRMWQNCF